MQYKITAYSPSTTHEIRELELDGNIIEDARLAQQRADSFATRLNIAQHMQATDWSGRVSPIHD
jgi:hypothetical protein